MRNKRKTPQYSGTTTPTRSKTMSHIKGKDTSIELVLRKALWRRGYRYRKNYSALPGTPDIAITKYKIAIFCDSEFFHGKNWTILKPKVLQGNNGQYWAAKIQSNIDRDARVGEELLADGWTVIHFWGKDILKNVEQCIQTVDEVVFDIQMAFEEDNF